MSISIITYVFKSVLPITFLYKVDSFLFLLLRSAAAVAAAVASPPKNPPADP